MQPTHRKLLRFAVTNLQTGVERTVLMDSFAIWEDLGAGCLQPTEACPSRFNPHSLCEGQAVVTCGSRFKRLDSHVYRRHTSMNNVAAMATSSAR